MVLVLVLVQALMMVMVMVILMVIVSYGLKPRQEGMWGCWYDSAGYWHGTEQLLRARDQAGGRVHEST